MSRILPDFAGGVFISKSTENADEYISTKFKTANLILLHVRFTSSSKLLLA